MRPITLATFAGANLAENPRLLAESVCVSIVDAEPGRGELRALNGRSTVASVPAGQQSIWRMGRDVPNDANYWLSWPSIVNVTLGFDGADTTERTYFSGSGSPKWTNNAIGLGSPPYPQATRELAVPAPIGQPIVTVNVNGGGNEATRFYVSTFVNDLGWESAPSPASNGIFCKDGANITVSNLEAAPAGSFGINRRRIYVTQPGTGGTADFYFLLEAAIGTTSVVDDARARGDLLATQGWLPPPADAHGLIGLWAGIFALLSGKTVWFSATSAPYAYPLAYALDLLDTPVATTKWEQNLLVLTTGQPVLFQGQDPAGMSPTPLALAQPCASARSVVAFGDGAAWASNEGLAWAGTGGQVLLTGPTAANPRGLVTEAQWKALNPASMIAGRWGRLYVCSYDDGSGRKGFMIDPHDVGQGLWFLSTGFDACHYDDLADALYVLEGTSVRRFGAGAALVPTAKSKEFQQTAPTAYTLAKVVANAYPVTIKVYADAVLKATMSLPDARAARIPGSGAYLAETWQVEVTGAAQAVRLANSVTDLKGL